MLILPFLLFLKQSFYLSSKYYFLIIMSAFTLTKIESCETCHLNKTFKGLNNGCKVIFCTKISIILWLFYPFISLFL